MADDIEKVIRAAKDQGFEVRVDADGYRHFHTADGRHVGHYPATPSRPARRLVRLIIDLRQAGMEWPPPSKSVLRSRRRRERGQ